MPLIEGQQQYNHTSSLLSLGVEYVLEWATQWSIRELANVLYGMFNELMAAN